MNPIHSSYGRERGYQAQGDPSTYVEDNRKSEQFRAELEDTSEQQDPKAGKSKRQWGISGLKEMHLAARAKVTKTPKVPPATPDHPAPLRIVKPPNAFELSADDTSRRNPQSQNASSASHIVPNDPSGIKYIYNKGANGLIRNPNARNLSSFGSTTAQADTSVVSDGDGTDEESPRLRLPRRALSSVPVASSDVNEAGGDNADNASNLMFANIVLRACLKYPELKGFGEESPQVAITRIFETYGNVTTPLRDRNGHLDPSGSSKKDLLKVDNDLRAARTELVDRNDEISRHEEETVTLNRQITSLKYRIRELETANDIRARNDLRALQAENERIKSMYEHQLRKEREDIHSERSKLNRRQKDDERVINDLNARLLKENTLWSQACTRLKDDNADLEDRLHAAKEEEDKRMNELVDKWDRKLQKERVKYEGLVETLETQNEKLQSALEHEKSHKQAELQDQRAKLEEQYKGEKEELRTEIEVFKVAVTQREHFKGLTDSEVANQYKRLANSIEDFARVEWSLSREGDWPLSDDRMRQLGKNPRKMKLQIVQNTLWMLLSKHVFCSPFRILGAAGEELDEGWAQIYSNGRCRIMPFLANGLRCIQALLRSNGLRSRQRWKEADLRTPKRI